MRIGPKPPVRLSPRVDGRYRSIRAKEKFAKDFVAAWTKVMKLDRFDHLIEAAHLSELGIMRWG
jgi:hypothetical protein